MQKQVKELERAAKPGGQRMKPEELDSLYVEERRLIESLQKENSELKLAAAGARRGRDTDVQAAQSEVRRLQDLVDTLRDEQRRAARLTAEQIERIREAFKRELDEKASECEAERARNAADKEVARVIERIKGLLDLERRA